MRLPVRPGRISLILNQNFDIRFFVTSAFCTTQFDKSRSSGAMQKQVVVSLHDEDWAGGQRNCKLMLRIVFRTSNVRQLITAMRLESIQDRIEIRAALG